MSTTAPSAPASATAKGRFLSSLFLDTHMQAAMSHMHWFTIFCLAAPMSLCAAIALSMDSWTNWKWVYWFLTLVDKERSWTIVAGLLSAMLALGIYSFIQFWLYRSSGALKTYLMNLTNEKVLGLTKVQMEPDEAIKPFSQMVSTTTKVVFIASMVTSFSGIFVNEWPSIAASTDAGNWFFNFVIVVIQGVAFALGFFIFGHLTMLFVPNLWVAFKQDRNRATRFNAAMGHEDRMTNYRQEDEEEKLRPSGTNGQPHHP